MGKINREASVMDLDFLGGLFHDDSTHTCQQESNNCLCPGQQNNLFSSILRQKETNRGVLVTGNRLRRSSCNKLDIYACDEGSSNLLTNRQSVNTTTPGMKGCSALAVQSYPSAASATCCAFSAPLGRTVHAAAKMCLF